MKLLIVTQKVDVRDDVLGFFHSWIAEFSKRCEHVTVICLRKGDHHLPQNVTVLSLGKEHAPSRLRYLTRFYVFIWQERNNYDAVFVHMNSVFVVLGGLLWRLWGKKIGLWYIHPKVGTYVRMAHFFARYIFTASEGSFPFVSPKVLVVGHGIDTDRFKPMSSIVKENNSILYVGRISPIKHLEVLVGAVKALHQRHVPFILNIIGGPDVRYGEYYERIKTELKDLEDEGVVRYHGKISNEDMPRWYNAYEALVNMTPSGSFDKTVLEAMASGTLVATSNTNFIPYLPKQCIFSEGDGVHLARALEFLFVLSPEEKRKYQERFRDTVVSYHNLRTLIFNITRTLS